MKRKLPICGILLGMLLASGCGGKQENDWKDLNSVFGKTQEETEDILGWDLQKAEEEPLSDQTMDGYALKLENIDFLGQKAEQIHMIFMEDLSGTFRLTRLYADYPDGETMEPAAEVPPQLSLFASQQDDERETALMKASIGLHKRFGKNSLVRGMDLFEAGTTTERNNQIGGHRK